MKMPNTVKKLKRKSFYLGDFIKHGGKVWICAVRDKHLCTFALVTSKKSGKVNYRKLFIVATNFKDNGNFKFEFM